MFDRYLSLTIVGVIRSFVILVVVSGCVSEDSKLATIKSGIPHFSVEPEMSTNLIAEKDLKNISIIPLEGISQSLIGCTGKVELDTSTGRWCILDNKQKRSIRVFDTNGTFIKRISQIGNRPSEYQQINDFYIADGQWIDLLDGQRRKLIKYDFASGELIEERKVPFYARKYTYLANGHLVFYKNSQANNLEQEKYFFKFLVLNPEMDEILDVHKPFELEELFRYATQNAFKSPNQS